MLVQLKKEISSEQRANIIKRIKELGFKTTEVKTQSTEYIIGTGNKEFDYTCCWKPGRR